MSDLTVSSGSGAVESGHAEVLQRLSTFLSAENVAEISDDLREMSDLEVPGVSFEPRKVTEVRGVYGDYMLDYGKTSIAIGTSLFTFSDLAEVEWQTTTPQGGRAVVQAAADFSGNNHPSLLVIEFPNSETKALGRVYSPGEAEAVSWLGQFLYELALVDVEVQKFRNRHEKVPAEESLPPD